jgi:preprotein translocase subunit SecD
MYKLTNIVSIIVIFLLIGESQAQPGINQSVCNKNVTVEKHQTGFCIIAAEADSVTLLPAARDDQRVVRYDYKYLLESERGKPLYILLPKTVDVSLVLAGTPELIDKGKNGFPELLFELTPEASIKLEKLTREHIGGKVAFLIDGETVTPHKIRSAIIGGQFQLTRCTDTACRIIYGRLLKNM